MAQELQAGAAQASASGRGRRGSTLASASKRTAGSKDWQEQRFAVSSSDGGGLVAAHGDAAERFAKRGDQGVSQGDTDHKANLEAQMRAEWRARMNPLSLRKPWDSTPYCPPPPRSVISLRKRYLPADSYAAASPWSTYALRDVRAFNFRVGEAVYPRDARRQWGGAKWSAAHARRACTV